MKDQENDVFELTDQKVIEEEFKEAEEENFKGSSLSELTQKESAAELETRIQDHIEKMKIRLKYELKKRVALRQAFQEACAEIFPDKNPDDFNEEDKKIFAELEEIYNTFKNKI